MLFAQNTLRLAEDNVGIFSTVVRALLPIPQEQQWSLLCFSHLSDLVLGRAFLAASHFLNYWW
jgi:hypothetical protein